MISIALVQTTDRNVNQLQSNIKQALQPLLINPLLVGITLSNVSLASGANTISHKLGRTIQGWMVTDVNGIATIYRSAPLNDSTLTLTSSAPVTASIYVF